MKLVLAEKPSVAQSIAKVLGATKREDGYLEGNGYVVSWCVGHLVELSQPEAYDEKYNKWAYGNVENGRSADGKQIFTARWKSCSLSHSPQTPFPTAPPLWPFTHIPTAPTTTINPSCPI